MTPERWQQIDQLFHAALAREPAKRTDFLASACVGDEPLRLEVESLLSFHEGAQSFIEKPAGDVAAELLGSHESGFEPGQQLGNYRIVRQLGSGGMGEVYLADDMRLDRKIALKLLPPQFTIDASRVRRFEQEARAASALNHPNIVTIYEIGQSNSAHFIATEFIDGVTLRDHLASSDMTLAEILDIAAQVASALAAAHDAGIVHRDIKPENLMLRRDGFVKVLDFGLAKLAHTVAVNGAQASPKAMLKTDPGMVMGTVQYMSPEQARSEEIDHRTDIWSLGVVLYEMLSGRVPFTGETPSHVIVSILEAEAPPLSHYDEAPEQLERIVIKALSKQRDERYQTARELALDLKSLRQELEVEARLKRVTQPDDNGRHERATIASGVSTADVVPAHPTSSAEYLVGEVKRHKTFAAAALVVLLSGAIGLAYSLISRNKTNFSPSGQKSIAVLPLKPIDTENRDQLYEFGIADSLILKLSSMKGLIVRPLSASRKYADIEQDPLAAGKEQQVDYVLASNYQLAGGRIRVTSQLFNVASGQIEETYKSEKDVANVFAVQDAIAVEIGKILLARFATTSSGAVAKRGTTNEEAYRLYLQGMYLIDQKRNPADAQKSAGIFEQAVRLDPNYAQAWAGKAHAHRAVASFGRSPDIHEEYQKSIEAINKALGLDENLADAHSALCENKMNYEYDFDGAERECKRAIELDPNSSLAHQIYSRYLMGRGRFDEAIAEIKIAIDLEPASLYSQRLYGNCLYNARRYGEAVLQFKRVIAMEPNFVTSYWWLSIALELQGNYAEAYEWWMKALALQKADEETVQSYKEAYQTSGWQGAMFERAKRFDKSGQAYFHGAAYHAQIGNKDKAFEYLEKSYQRRELWMYVLNVEPRLDSLRGDPRFDELVKRVELK
jgi:serine/threonine protein kinase/Tfp pilus assembly protein PilF